MHDTLKKIPLFIGIDLETTGSSFTDRIVEIALIRFEYGEPIEKYEQRINPQIPIPPATTQIHGITDQDVADKPTFQELSSLIHDKIKNSVLFGYNVIFDFNVLSHEFVRSGYKHLNPKMWTLIDPFAIWKKQDPKTLSHAYQFFCGQELKDAHNALHDIEATFDVLNAQLDKYQDLPKSFTDLGSYCYAYNPAWVCSSYHFIWSEKGEIICNFGKNKGKKLKDLVHENPQFLKWIQNKEFPEDVKALVHNALNQVFPQPKS